MTYRVRRANKVGIASGSIYRALRLFVSLSRTHPDEQFTFVREDGLEDTPEDIAFREWLVASEVHLGDICEGSLPALRAVYRDGAVAAINGWLVDEAFPSVHEFTLARLAGTCAAEVYYLPSGKKA